jgi:hypothetical protein
VYQAGPAANVAEGMTVTTTSHTASTAQTSRTATQAAWLFPGRTELALVVNWRQATMEAMLHDLKTARELEYLRDSTLFRLFSARCSMARAFRRTDQHAASG